MFKEKAAMSKDVIVSAKVPEDIKDQVDEILKAVGMTTSSLVNTLYRQVIFHRGIPYAIRIPRDCLTVTAMTRQDLEIITQKREQLAQAALKSQGEDDMK
jgi:addiction module RelB/DinJ family antitoxin